VNIKIIRVLGDGSKKAVVMALVEGKFVKWSRRQDWDCECLTDADEFECEHIEAIRSLLHVRVLPPNCQTVAG
jgi:hypothetical protein